MPPVTRGENKYAAGQEEDGFMCVRGRGGGLAGVLLGIT